MIKELEKIRKESTNIMGDYPERHEKLLAQYAEAKKDLLKSIEAKNEASDLAEFDAATKEIERKGARVDFISNAIVKLESQPRMSEEDYQKAVSTCEKIMSESVNKYRMRTFKLMEALKEIHDEYRAEAAEVNETLIILDNAANVVQSKFTPKSVSDTWENHSIRYKPDRVCREATRCDEEERIVNPLHAHDSVLSAAWSAVSKAFPHRTF